MLNLKREAHRPSGRETADGQHRVHRSLALPGSGRAAHIQAAGKAFTRAIEHCSEAKLHQRHHSREPGKDKWAKRVEHCLAYPSTMMGWEVVPMGHHDEQGVTLDESSASTARRHDHALYLVWRQVFTAVAGVV